MNPLLKFAAFLLPCLLLVRSPANHARADDKPAPGRVSFKVLTGEQTGLKDIVGKWRETEAKRQGGEKLSWWLWGVGAFDYDNDGCLDLILQQHAAPGSIILRGQFKEKGTLTFANVTEELGVGGAVLPGTFKPRVWDIDGNGWLDIVGTDAKPNTCFFNKGGKKFEAMKFGFGQLASLEDVRDLNGDGYPDVYSVREGNQFLYDPAARTFKKSPNLPPLHAKPPECIAEVLRTAKEGKNNRYLKIHYFEGADLNGDGIPDVVMSGYAPYGGDSFGRYLVADQKGELTDQTAALGLPKVGTPILVADLTGDGAAEIMIATGSKAGLYVNDGKGRFTLQEGDLQKFLAFRDPYLQKVSLVDFNCDGLPDLVVSQPRSGNEGIYENRGGGKFERVVRARGWDADPIAIGDFNDDGLPDVIIGGPGDTVTVYLNATAQPGRSCKLYPRMDKPNPFAVGTRVEVYASGELGKPGAKPIWVGTANPDGTPLHVGLGTASEFDLRAVFPGKTPITVEQKKVQVKAKLRVTPDGKVEDVRSQLTAGVLEG
jgi:hypothetical protein